ncbi:transporter substrate-binding domain-containing protein [Salinicoccus roseus]|uniref:transporter substrate-binding domain-containing protein n=1 Tax=Salinicoccus roseus TaxID=45670 RepID=UPI002301A7C5|nr:transporter substrate-binding domain-containing protein [Salinicoccus roseus]
MKKLILPLAFVLFLIAGCGNEAESGSVEETEGENIIKIGSSPDGYPLSFQEDGEVKGFNADIYNAIFDELNYEIEWVMTDWTGVLANLDTGNVDTASNFAMTPERAEKYTFSDPYYNSKAAVAVAEDNETIQSVSDLEGADVGTILGTNFQNVLNEEYPDHGGEIIDYENNEVVYNDVIAGKIDAYLFGREQLLAMINDRDIALEIAGEPFGVQPVALPFKDTPENQELISDINDVLAELRSDGTLAEISEKWYGMDIYEEETE